MDRVVRTDKDSNKLTMLWIALSLYSGIGLLGTWFPAMGKLTLPCLVLSVLATVAVIITNIKWTGHERDRRPGVLIMLLVAWMGYMYFTSGTQILWWVNYIKQYDFISYSWVWVLFIPQLALLRSFYRVIEIISYIGVVLVLLSFWKYTSNAYMQFLCEAFTLGAGFVVLTQRYHMNHTNAICYIILLLGFLTATTHARRNLMLTSGCYLMVAGCQLMFSTLIKSKGTRMLIIMTFLFALLCSTGFYLSENRGMFKKITDRAADNTREYVYLHFAADMGTNMQDLMMGRSMKGTYECGGVEGESGNEGQRDVVECGYLNNILKGGIIYLVLYVAVLIAAIIRGFKCSNALGKACAWILLFQLSDMVYFGIHSFNLKSYMLWMLVAIALNKELMKKTDDELLHMLYVPKPELPNWKR